MSIVARRRSRRRRAADQRLRRSSGPSSRPRADRAGGSLRAASEPDAPSRRVRARRPPVIRTAGDRRTAPARGRRLGFGRRGRRDPAPARARSGTRQVLAASFGREAFHARSAPIDEPRPRPARRSPTRSAGSSSATASATRLEIWLADRRRVPSDCRRAATASETTLGPRRRSLGAAPDGHRNGRAPGRRAGHQARRGDRQDPGGHDVAGDAPADAESRLLEPTPMIAVEITCVVETGSAEVGRAEDDRRGRRLRGEAVDRVELDDLLAHRLDDPPAAGRGPQRDRRRRRRGSPRAARRARRDDAGREQGEA